MADHCIHSLAVERVQKHKRSSIISASSCVNKHPHVTDTLEQSYALTLLFHFGQLPTKADMITSHNLVKYGCLLRRVDEAGVDFLFSALHK